tara:strand:+ start:323 stop:490 length:168 start_codon:yes stop_codon:yes gene_type:complete
MFICTAVDAYIQGVGIPLCLLCDRWLVAGWLWFDRWLIWNSLGNDSAYRIDPIPP